MIQPSKNTSPQEKTASSDKIFVADKSEVMCDLIKCHLEHDGYSSDTTTDANTLSETDFSPYKAMILDYSMLAEETYDYVENHVLNGDTCDVALIVTYTPDPDTAVTIYDTLDAGADAIVRKPFSMKELAARIKSVLRRRFTSASMVRIIRRISHDGLAVDLYTHTVYLNDTALDIPRQQAQLLAYLMSNRNNSYRADKLGAALWPDHPEWHNDAFISPLISALKQSLGQYSSYLTDGPEYAYCYVE
ncbi:MAG: hypothetical protein K2M98_01650 [Muribaculum sp.]|nr:hypothetical protein [Muribaculum sp.]